MKREVLLVESHATVLGNGTAQSEKGMWIQCEHPFLSGERRCCYL